MHIRMPLISAYNEYKYFITYKINLFYYLLLLSQFYRFVSDLESGLPIFHKNQKRWRIDRKKYKDTFQ